MKRPQLAKLTRPRLHRAVARERLFALLDEAREHKPAIFVVGPPGAGKTTLVASWLDARGIKGIWYQVDPGDADLATFFYYLGEAAKPFTRKGQRPLSLLTPEYLHDVEGFSRRFFREMFARLQGATLVFDNYQEVTPEHHFHQLIAQAVDEVPDGNTLIALSRRDPPDCYARLIANEGVALVDWENLKLTLEEAQSIAIARRHGDCTTIRELHERSGGWAAGLVLMLENLGSDAVRPDTATESQQKVFSYFAAQIFQRIPDETRQLLLATADLPWVEAELGELLAGTGNAARILDDLCRRHLFIHRRAGAKPSYQYHALFKEFLKARADDSLPKAERTELRLRGAQFLERTGSVAEAFNLYREAQAWHAATPLILCHAPDLVAHGRFQTLADWVAALPETVVQAEPWLAYWHGRALVPLDPASGRRRLEQAHVGFLGQSDVVGEVAAAASIIDSMFIDNRHFVAMDPWIEILDRRLKTLQSLPSAAMELRVYSSGLVAMLYRQPANPLIAPWLARIVSLLELEIDVNNRVSAAISVLTYASASGDFAAGHRVRALVEPIVSRDEVAPAHRFLWRAWLGYFLMLLGEYTEAEANYCAAAEVNNDNQFPWSANLLFIKALCFIGQGDMQPALACLDGIEPIANRSRPQDLGYLHVARAWKGMMTGGADQALHESQSALAIAREIGNFSLTIVWFAPTAWALASMNRYEEFVRTMDSTLEEVRGTCYRRPHVELLALKAWLHVRRDERDAARAALSEALGLAKVLDHGAFFHRICRFCPELLAFTAVSGVETYYVQGLIRKFNWPAPSPDVEPWPWPTRVYTLGRFEVVVDNKPLSFPRKTPRRLTGLLKTLVSLGGREVPEQKLIDALWPEEEGDAARHALTVALHRLRRLLGDAHALQVEDGKISLNRERVWIDALEVDRVFTVAKSALGRGDRVAFDHAVKRVGVLYQGQFLPADSDVLWSVSMRERLKAGFVQFVADYGEQLESSGHWNEAADWYRRGLAADDLSESFYQGLMRCHLETGQRAEGLSVFRRMRQTLSVTLGIPPSPQSEALYHSLQIR